MICKRIFSGNCLTNRRTSHQLFKSDVHFTVYRGPKVWQKPVKFGQNYFSQIILSNLHGQFQFQNISHTLLQQSKVNYLVVIFPFLVLKTKNY